MHIIMCVSVSVHARISVCRPMVRKTLLPLALVVMRQLFVTGGCKLLVGKHLVRYVQPRCILCWKSGSVTLSDEVTAIQLLTSKSSARTFPPHFPYVTGYSHPLKNHSEWERKLLLTKLIKYQHDIQ